MVLRVETGLALALLWMYKREVGRVGKGRFITFILGKKRKVIFRPTSTKPNPLPPPFYMPYQ